MNILYYLMGGLSLRKEQINLHRKLNRLVDNIYVYLKRSFSVFECDLSNNTTNNVWTPDSK